MRRLRDDADVDKPPPGDRPAFAGTCGKVIVLNFETMKLSTGSGFFISSDGLMVTSHHVIEDGDPIGVVLNDGRQVTISEVVMDDEDVDLAVVRVNGSDVEFLYPSGPVPLR